MTNVFLLFFLMPNARRRSRWGLEKDSGFAARNGSKVWSHFVPLRSCRAESHWDSPHQESCRQVRRGCRVQRATCDNFPSGWREKWIKRVNHAPCNGQISQIRPPNFYISPELIALIGSPCQMSPEALIGDRKQEAHAAITAPTGEKNQIKSNDLYLQFARTGSHLPLLRPQPWLRRSLLRLGKPPLTAGRNAMLCLSSRY